MLSKMLNLKVRNDFVRIVTKLPLCFCDSEASQFMFGCRRVQLSVCFGCQDCLRPSVESILQSSLLADAVAEEQRRAQLRLRRKSADSDCPVHKPSEPSPASASELRLREQALRDREKALKEREERLERKAFISTLLPATQTRVSFICTVTA